MVFPTTQQLVDRVRQVYNQVSWELFAVSLLRGIRYGCVRRWDSLISYLVTWGDELHLRASYLVDNYNPTDIVDLAVRDSVLTPEDEWTSLTESERVDWDEGPIVLYTRWLSRQQPDSEFYLELP